MGEYRDRSGRDVVLGKHHVPAYFLILGVVFEGEKGKQDKGNVSRTLPSDCLHIVFSRDMSLAVGDRLSRDAGNLPLLTQKREILTFFSAWPP